MTERIYSLPIDSTMDSAIKEFEKQLAPGEKITSTTVADKKLIITTHCGTPKKAQEHQTPNTSQLLLD